jgi:hypothetical protein
MASETAATDRAAEEIWEILYDLPSPRAAAKALAAAHLRLIEEDGASSESEVRAKLHESTNAVMEAWSAQRQ